MKDVSRFSLGQICDFQAGGVFPKRYQGEKEGDYPFIKVSDMNSPLNLYRINSSENWVSDQVRKNLRAPIHIAGATVFAKIGIAIRSNRRRLLMRPTLIDNNMMSATPRPSVIDPRFFFYLLSTIDFNEISTGTALPFLRLMELKEIEVLAPCIVTQQKIAAILSAYDDLIENNLRRIKILEEMAQTLYREWFVKFGFPGHQKIKMADSPLGKIPEGWEVSTVGDNITVVPRKNKIKTSDYLTEGVIPVIDQGKDLIAGYIDDTSLAYDGPLPIIVFGDHTCVLKWVAFRFAVGADGTQLIQPEYPKKLPPNFLFYTLQFVPLEQFGYQRHFKYLKEAKILIPSGNLAQKFEEVVSTNTALILNLQRQNLNLRRTRDLLLPKLISGELDVSGRDITISEANA